MSFKSILIVDDSSTSRMIIQRCFVIAGYADSKYSFAENGLDAFSRLKEDQSIDLILTDLNMPKMDGEILIKKLKLDSQTRKVPIIVISSIADSGVESELSKMDILGVIKKPISPAKVQELMGGIA